MDLVAKFEGVLSGYDGAGLCIARVDVWLSIVCKVNIEANAILSIGNPLDVRNALTQAKTAWNTALANRRSELIHANKDALHNQIACERSKGGRHGFLSGFEHCIQDGIDGLAMPWLTKGGDVLKSRDRGFIERHTVSGKASPPGCCQVTPG